jgi:lipid II:glycine glycyltransferase (peptidoglycan interpeptide bridge formation enzyme)
MPLVDATTWTEFTNGAGSAHLLQTGGWGELKAAFGWQAVRLIVGDSGAQVLFRKLPLGYTIAYLPKGPIGENWDGLWPEIDRVCQERRAVFLKVEPDRWVDESSPLLNADPAGFSTSPQAIQPQRTLILSIDPPEDDILGRMKQKTRYNISLAARKGVTVEPSDDFETFHRMSEITGERDGFHVHSAEYFRKAYTLFHPHGMCELLFARYEGTALAGLMVFACGKRAWYLYGASTDRERNRMPSYLLQWEAIRWARGRGCSEYDLWGVPDEDSDTLEAEFTSRGDGLWGVYRFKRGFGGTLRRAAGPWDRVYNPLFYRAYSWRAARRVI